MESTRIANPLADSKQEAVGVKKSHQEGPPMEVEEVLVRKREVVAEKVIVIDKNLEY